jgi:hypothetical protein
MSTATGAIKTADSSPGQDWSAKRVNTILTVRGMIILAFLAFLYYSPVRKETDIIAAVIVYVFSAYVLILALTTLFYPRFFLGLLEIKAFQPESLNTPGSAMSGVPALFLMELNEVYLPPGFYLEVQVEFEEDTLAPAKHILSGKIHDKYFLKEHITFPHRGYWRISKINFTFADKLNLTANYWNLNDQIGTTDLLVNPPTSRQSSLPVISSSNRVGDTLPDLNEKHGDPFDLKPYHPSDGMKKILWKVYAKSGELISRHPEASMTPEGQVLIFACAGKADEEVCSSALAYLKQIESLNLEILFSCLGAADWEVARNSQQSQELLIDTVWKSEAPFAHSPELDIDSLIGYFKSKSTDSRIDRVLVFCGKRRLSTPGGFRSMVELGEYLESRSIRPFFCLISSFSINYEEPSSNLWRRLFFINKDKTRIYQKELYYDFLSVCRNKGWEYEEETVE